MEVLDYKFYSKDLNRQVTIREYFKALLLNLWCDDNFTGKRPFGSSGWQFDIYAALIRGGYIKGWLDSDGYVDKVDEQEAHEFVISQIINRI